MSQFNAIQEIPVEIFHRISQDIRKKDCARLLRVSSAFHRIFLPTVYATVALHDLTIAAKCARTMTKCTKVNLPGMVRSLSVRNDKHVMFTQVEYEKFERRFVECLDRMDNLRDVVFARMQAYEFAPTILLTLFKRPQLRSVSIHGAMITRTNPVSSRPPIEWTLFEGPTPDVPSLTAFELSSYRCEDAFQRYISGILKHRAQHLQTLSLAVGHVGEWDILRFPIAMPALTTLELSASALTSPVLFEHTPNVTHLSIYVNDDGDKTSIVASLPSHVLPRLTYYNGPSNILSQLHLLQGRPLLSTIELDGATFRPETHLTTHDHPPSFAPPEWSPVVAGVLRPLADTNVRRVALYMGDPEMDLLEPVVPFLKRVEHVKLYLSGDWYFDAQFAKRIFTHLPNLRSFLLSDYPRFVWVDDDYGRFEEALDTRVQKRVLEAWDAAMKEAGGWKLRRAAFTSLFAWNRQDEDDGSSQWVCEKAPSDKRLYRNYEGTDEDDSGRSCGGESDESDDDDSD